MLAKIPNLLVSKLTKVTYHVKIANIYYSQLTEVLNYVMSNYVIDLTHYMN